MRGRSRSSRHLPEARPGAVDTWTADDPEHWVTSPRPQERVLTGLIDPTEVVPSPVLPAVWRPATVPQPSDTAKGPRRKPARASVVVPVTVRPPSEAKAPAALFRPILKGSQRSICDQRSERRKALFVTGVAGTNKRASPGPYKRKVTSSYGC